MDKMAAELGGIDILAHAADVLTPVDTLMEADLPTCLKGYKTAIFGTMVMAQSAVLANKDTSITFVHLIGGGMCFPPFPDMGAYMSSYIAALELLDFFCRQEPASTSP